jgi:hypothetical protein
LSRPMRHRAAAVGLAPCWHAFGEASCAGRMVAPRFPTTPQSIDRT